MGIFSKGPLVEEAEFRVIPIVVEDYRIKGSEKGRFGKGYAVQSRMCPRHGWSLEARFTSKEEALDMLAHLKQTIQEE